MVPTYTVPFEATAGEELMAAPVFVEVHLSVPLVFTA